MSSTVLQTRMVRTIGMLYRNCSVVSPPTYISIILVFCSGSRELRGIASLQVAPPNPASLANGNFLRPYLAQGSGLRGHQKGCLPPLLVCPVQCILLLSPQGVWKLSTFGFFVLNSTLLHVPPLRFCGCRRMLGSNSVHSVINSPSHIPFLSPSYPHLPVPNRDKHE